ncbi:MAG: orotate phosphoribosyltransferase [Candidatus Omnitrophica bacterium]|nr:orotate phosphoribosyltransferase [Candidatus Omnitrophota bacterium]
MLTRDQLLEMFRRSNALQRGHFELSSGLHSGHYFQCAQVLQFPKQATAICHELARRFTPAKPTVVIGPAVGGLIVAFETARVLGVRAMYAERVDAEMQLRRGFTVSKKDRVLIVEDAMTTGESGRKVADLVSGFGAKVVGIGTVVDRSGGKVRFPGRKFIRLLSLAFETFPPHDCPLCSEQIPVSRPGRVITKAVV